MNIYDLQPTCPNSGTVAEQVLHHFNDDTARTVYVSDVEFPYPDGALIVGAPHPGGETDVDVAAYPRELLGAHQRAHVGGRVLRITDADGVESGDEPVDELVVDARR